MSKPNCVEFHRTIQAQSAKRLSHLEIDEAYGDACYEAGKRDALPVWPPPAGSRFTDRDDDHIKWDGDMWLYMSEFSGYQKAWDQLQCTTTAAYLMGELTDDQP